MTPAYRILRRAGPLRSGAESGKGTLWHAVPADSPGFIGPALCGVRPAIQWTTDEGDTVTCPRCRRVLARKAAA